VEGGGGGGGMNIELHIERLILDGLALTPSERAQAQAAVEAELIRLLTVDGLNVESLAGGALPSLRGEAIQVMNGNDGARLGTQIAQSVHRGLQNGPDRNSKGGRNDHLGNQPYQQPDQR
jgi:hypothetical protein